MNITSCFEPKDFAHTWSGPQPLEPLVVVFFVPSLYVPLVSRTRPLPSTALDVLHHQHTEGGAGHSGRAFVTDVGI